MDYFRNTQWVSIHAPAWGATFAIEASKVALKCFNPRTRMGCDLTARLECGRCACFNPRTRMGCDDRICINSISTISFNPRTRMGCDKVLCLSSNVSKRFNPRTRMGCDFNNSLRKSKHRVSIHAPAWGATQQFRHWMRLERFQSTHPHGVRLQKMSVLVFGLSFNPRTRMGCDTLCSDCCIHPYCFNPRTRMGCDLRLWFLCRVPPVSIHAPAWGATVNYLGYMYIPDVSIHAPAWGATAVGSR